MQQAFFRVISFNFTFKSDLRGNVLESLKSIAAIDRTLILCGGYELAYMGLFDNPHFIGRTVVYDFSGYEETPDDIQEWARIVKSFGDYLPLSPTTLLIQRVEPILRVTNGSIGLLEKWLWACKTYAAAKSKPIDLSVLRMWVSITLGATLMLDPNQRDCVFYPEEIEALLRDGSVGIAIPCRIEENTRVMASRPRKIPIRMASALRKIYSKMDAVRSAYLTVVRWESSRPYPTLFIAVIVDRNERERVLRATVAAIQPHITEPGLSIDVAAVDPEKERSHPFAKGTRIYRRN